MGGAPSLCQMATSGRAHTEVIPGSSTTSVCVPTVNHSQPLPAKETVQDQQVALSQARGVTAFPWVSVHVKPCAFSKS